MSRRRCRVTAKRKERAKDELRAQQQRLGELARILKLMGLDDFRRRLRGSFPSWLARTFPKPQVLPDPTLESDNHLQAKAEELRRDLEKVNIRIGHDTLSYADYFSVYLGLGTLFKAGERFSTNPDERRGCEQDMGRLTRFVERYEPEMLKGYYAAIRRFVALNSRLDGSIYTVKHQASRVGRKLVWTITLGRTRPETQTINSGGLWRRAFRCGAMEDYDAGEITWTAWDAEVIGPGTSGPLPVYIQSHAIEQAYKRLGFNASHYFLHSFLIESLHHPRVTPGRDGHLLVEVSIGWERVGYLVAERIDDKVLVKTFLLITMQGTPEGSRLHRRLRMGRADMDYLQLDSLPKLALTDLLRDDDIAGIFRECGCEGLLSLARMDHGIGVLNGYATEFKTYFGQGLTPLLPR